MHILTYHWKNYTSKQRVHGGIAQETGLLEDRVHVLGKELPVIVTVFVICGQTKESIIGSVVEDLDGLVLIEFLEDFVGKRGV